MVQNAQQMQIFVNADMIHPPVMSAGETKPGSGLPK
jgi:hypothetical protein